MLSTLGAIATDHPHTRRTGTKTIINAMHDLRLGPWSKAMQHSLHEARLADPEGARHEQRAPLRGRRTPQRAPRRRELPLAPFEGRVQVPLRAKRPAARELALEGQRFLGGFRAEPQELVPQPSELSRGGGPVAALQALHVAGHVGRRASSTIPPRSTTAPRSRGRSARSSRPCADSTRLRRRRVAARMPRGPHRGACGGRERARAASRGQPRVSAPRRRPGRIASRRALRSVRAIGPRAAAYTADDTWPQSG